MWDCFPCPSLRWPSLSISHISHYPRPRHPHLLWFPRRKRQHYGMFGSYRSWGCNRLMAWSYFIVLFQDGWTGALDGWAISPAIVVQFERNCHGQSDPGQSYWVGCLCTVRMSSLANDLYSASAGYAFVDFGSTMNAQRALNTFNGTIIPNTHKQFKLNWASGGGLIDRR